LPVGQRASQEALNRAAEQHITVPQGYTYVRPFLKGHGQPEEKPGKPTPIYSRGLATIAVVLEHEETKEG
jgi:hypothetical protein